MDYRLDPPDDPPTCPKCDSQDIEIMVDYDGEKEYAAILCNEEDCDYEG